jgi:cytochrome c oxidase assembly protein subunit 15
MMSGALSASAPVWNVAPLLELLALAMLLALLPLGWWAWKTRGMGPMLRFRALLVLAAFLTFDLVVFGAFTRLSDSGLGCPDWPGCYGHASPIGARENIAMAQQALPTGPVTHQKAWIEMIHRYLAMTVGALILWLCLWSLWARAKGRPLGDWRWPTISLVWVLVQGAFGAWTVTLKLYPAIVTVHLLLGLGLLALLVWQATRLACAPWPPLLGLNGVCAALWRWAWPALTLALCVQIALGGWVSTNYAVLACSDFPTCQGQWWPQADWSTGFSLLRPLGQTAQGATLPFEALTAIHLMHRLGALALLLVWALVLALLWRAQRLDRTGVQAGKGPGRLMWGLLVLAGVQLSSGVSNVVLDWPLAAALTHSAGAALWVSLLAWGWAKMPSRLHAHHD